jgi:hypothetical protein
MTVPQNVLLAEVDDLLRTQPPLLRQSGPEAVAWLGRAAALVSAWSSPHSVAFALHHSQSLEHDAAGGNQALTKLLTLLHQMRFDLLLKTRGPLSTVVDRGMVFDYFDELRKIIEPAWLDVFFVDPYLDADFVARYLSHVNHSAGIRLLAREKLSTLMPAVRMFTQQHGRPIEVRSAQIFTTAMCLLTVRPATNPERRSRTAGAPLQRRSPRSWTLSMPSARPTSRSGMGRRSNNSRDPEIGAPLTKP